MVKMPSPRIGLRVADLARHHVLERVDGGVGIREHVGAARPGHGRSVLRLAGGERLQVPARPDVVVPVGGPHAGDPGAKFPATYPDAFGRLEIRHPGFGIFQVGRHGRAPPDERPPREPSYIGPLHHPTVLELPLEADIGCHVVRRLDRRVEEPEGRGILRADQPAAEEVVEHAEAGTNRAASRSGGMSDQRMPAGTVSVRETFQVS